MSCNGCRVLRKGCSDSCILRPCLQWIESAEAQGHATVFVAKFFGRAGLMNFLNSVPEQQRPSLFQSLLFEACGRTVNPVNGAVGLLWTGNWHVCQAAVETVLRGGTLRPAAILDDEAAISNMTPHHASAATAAPDLFCRSRGPVSAAAAASSGTKRRKATSGLELDCNYNSNNDDAAARASRLDAADLNLCLSPVFPRRPGTPSEESGTTSAGSRRSADANDHAAPQLLNLFV